MVDTESSTILSTVRCTGSLRQRFSPNLLYKDLFLSFSLCISVSLFISDDSESSLASLTRILRLVKDAMVFATSPPIQSLRICKTHKRFFIFFLVSFRFCTLSLFLALLLAGSPVVRGRSLSYKNLISRLEPANR